MHVDATSIINRVQDELRRRGHDVPGHDLHVALAAADILEDMAFIKAANTVLLEIQRATDGDPAEIDRERMATRLRVIGRLARHLKLDPERTVDAL